MNRQRADLHSSFICGCLLATFIVVVVVVFKRHSFNVCILGLDNWGILCEVYCDLLKGV